MLYVCIIHAIVLFVEYRIGIEIQWQTSGHLERERLFRNSAKIIFLGFDLIFGLIFVRKVDFCEPFQKKSDAFFHASVTQSCI